LRLDPLEPNATVFDAIHEKRLRAKKYGRRTLILKEDAEEFLKSLSDVDR